MGQYHLIVNPDKMQYLDPHNFGCGLKLMEFTNTPFGPQAALCVLLSTSNGRGGGDLDETDLTPEQQALIGSWAGDRVYVVGDYADDWQYVPEDWRGRVYTDVEEGAKGRKKKVKRQFGDGEGNCSLYAAARYLCKDISDDIIKVVALAEKAYGHPWAAIDVSDNGWRRVPRDGVLPDEPPKKPIAGKEAYDSYVKTAVPIEKYAMQIIEAAVRQAEGEPAKEKIIEFAMNKLGEIKAKLKKAVST